MRHPWFHNKFCNRIGVHCPPGGDLTALKYPQPCLCDWLDVVVVESSIYYTVDTSPGQSGCICPDLSFKKREGGFFQAMLWMVYIQVQVQVYFSIQVYTGS